MSYSGSMTGGEGFGVSDERDQGSAPVTLSLELLVVRGDPSPAAAVMGEVVESAGAQPSQCRRHLIAEVEEEEEEEEEGLGAAVAPTAGDGKEEGDEENVLAIELVDVPHEVAPERLSKFNIVRHAINVIVDGDVGIIGSGVREWALENLHQVYQIPEDVVLRVPRKNEVTCSNADPEAYLFEFMFQ